MSSFLDRNSSKEIDLENQLLKKLKKLGYQEVSIKTQQDLEFNFQKQFLEYNLKNKIDPNFTEKNN
ncbi:hypothetical protein LFWB_6800 [Candidatus Phytoplasma luffae]|uniref:Uncharacterized protein n=1 Tax=Loofah witches'-broom phytoplasma TaxID=35773 RepID=A0A975IMA0_LOWBP|nr:hypothetical protein [Candidatus Phytoplasma luffae]QTX03233.1 hypothetical protein LFWB_6800 [Candidatus Phytoplasma luffae]